MSTHPTEPNEPADEPTTVQRWKGRAQRTRLAALAQQRRLEEMRPRNPLVEIGFRWLERDTRIAGGVLGGGLAYRLFFYSLAVALLVTGGLGFGARSPEDIESTAEDIGIGRAMADAIAQTAENAEQGRWILLIMGTVLVTWSSWGLFRALRLVHAAAWWTEGRRIAPQRAVAGVIGVTLVSAALVVAVGAVRAWTGPLVALLAVPLIIMAFGGVWLWASSQLLPARIPMSAHLPGAVVFALGYQVLNVFVAFFLADRLASSSALYGALGVAGTILFYLYLLGRLVVWSAELNAVVYEMRARTSGTIADDDAFARIIR